jgi:predicted negative regulator of RcsB-dependent stress response
MSDPKTPATPAPATAAAPPEAKFEWTASPFEAFLELHFKKILIALTLIAVGVGGWLVWKQRAEEQRIREGQAFSGSETLEDFKKVIANFPGSTAAGSAQVMIANLLAQNNDIPGVIEELGKFLATYPDHPLVDQATFRIAALTAQSDPKAGLEKLEAFIAGFPKSPFYPLARLRRADVLAATGDIDKAAAEYQAILDDNTLAGNPVRAQATDRLAKVKLKRPAEVEFVPEPTPPPPAPAAVPPTDPAPPGATPEINVPAFGLDAPAPSTAPPLVPTDAAPDPSPAPPPAEPPPPATPPTPPPQ